VAYKASQKLRGVGASPQYALGGSYAL